MSFDFNDRQKLDKILALFDDNSFQTITVMKLDPYQHLDQLAEKVRYDMANCDRWGHVDREGALSNVLKYIDEIKAGEK